jgi:predicted NUDIX family phosphoesterase
MRDDNEEVLVVARSVLDAAGVFNGLAFDVGRYLPSIMDPSNHRFLPRHQVESDPAWKQLIPYFIILCGDRVWYYVRSGRSGEGRLVARLSIGVGGHINRTDLRQDGTAYDAGADRELEEEVRLPGATSRRICALLNDDSNPVGKVHLGVVSIVRVSDPNVASLEDTVTESGFATPGELASRMEQMETWSQICFRDLARLAREPTE